MIATNPLPPSSLVLGDLARRISRFDTTVSLLAALLVVVVAAVLFLGSAWISTWVWPPAPKHIGEVEFVPRALHDAGEEGEFGDDPAGGDNTGDKDRPDDVPAANPPLDTTGVAAILPNTMDAVSEQIDDFTPAVLRKGLLSSGTGGRSGGTAKRGSGLGDGAVAPNERWTVIYNEAQTIELYARQLDHFGIELGVVSGNSLTSVANLSARTPIVKNNAGHDNRLYFQWRDIGRRKADATLLQKAGINSENMQIVHFYPKAVEETMTTLEKQFKGRDLKDIRLTTFAVRRQGKGFELFVVAQFFSNG